MSASTKTGIYPGIFLAIVWLAYALGDYLFHHAYYARAVADFQYWGFIIFSAAVFVLFVWWRAGRQNLLKDFKLQNLRGWHWYLLFWLFCWALLGSFLSKNLPDENTPALVAHFTVKSLLLQSALAFITLSGYAAGRLVLKPLQNFLQTTTFTLASVAVGFSLIGILLFLQGAVAPIQGILFLIVMAVLIVWQYKPVLDLLKSIFLKPVSVGGLSLWQVFPIYIFMIFLAAGWIDSVKLIPIEYDGLNLYGNLARNLGVGKELLGGYQPYNWSLFMSLGWHLFGSSSVGLLLSFLPGWLALAATYRLARVWLPVSASWLAAAVLITVPMFVYQLGGSEKIDLALLFFQLIILLVIIELWQFSGAQPADKKVTALTEHITFLKWQVPLEVFVWAVAGWLSGYAFGVKLTAFFMVFGLLTMLFYKNGNRQAFFGSFLTGFGLFFLLNIQKLAAAPAGSLNFKLFCAFFLIVGLFLLYKYFQDKKPLLLKSLRLSAVFFAFTLLAFSPWLIANMVKTQGVSIEKMIQGKDNTPAIEVGDALMSQEGTAAAGGKSVTFQNTTRREELDRYMGYTEGFAKYLGIFYRLTMNTEIKNRIYVEIGLFFLLFLPFLMFEKREGLKIISSRNVAALLTLLLVLAISVYTAWTGKGDLNAALNAQTAAQPAGIRWLFEGFIVPVTTLLYSLGSIFKSVPLLFGNTYIFFTIFISLVLTGFWYWLSLPSLRRFPVPLKALSGFLTGYVLLWLWLGNGIPWYGILAFPLMVVLGVYLVAEQKETLWRTYFRTAVVALLLMGVFLRFSSTDRQGMANNAEIFYMPSIAYSTGMVTKEMDILKNIGEAYAQGANAVNVDLTGKVYRVGTYIHYFIKDNHRRVFEDNQLGYFQDVLTTLDNPVDFVDVLKKNGFRYILFNPKDVQFDQTPEQTFRKKFDRFLQVMSGAPNVRVLSTNNIIADPNGTVRLKKSDGSVLNGSFGIKGETIKLGDLAVLEIL